MKLLMILLLGAFGYHQPDSRNLAVKSGETYELKVVVTNVKSHSGLILLGIYNKPDRFLEEGGAYSYTSHKAKVVGNQIEIIFKNIPKGSYAISLCHDVNADHKCNLNFLGIPLEPYGFTNVSKIGFSKPSFNDCKFELNQNKTVKVQLIH